MIGFSCYILADVFFIARGIGADALAALNLTLPAYNLMNGIGLMIGMGGAARYSLSSTRPDSDTHRTAFTHALLLAALCALFFSFAGAFCSEEISAILGADHDTIGYASDYIRILLLFSPLFLGNTLLLCFVRNDGAPRLSMAGMLIGSLANIVLDYIFIYPLGMEMAGAATATATAPVISMLIMSVHFIKKNNRFHITKIRLSLKRAADICFLGVSSLVLELSSGIVIIVFNFLILKLNGNTGVAAYGILANIALVLTSVFTGIAQGIQPIVSRHADAKGKHVQNSIRKYALITSLLLSLVSYITISLFSVPIAEAFNKADDPLLTTIASGGMRIYFINLFFAGVNIIASAFLCSCDKPKLAFVISVLRGFIWIDRDLAYRSCHRSDCMPVFIPVSFSRHTHSNSTVNIKRPLFQAYQKVSGYKIHLLYPDTFVFTYIPLYAVFYLHFQSALLSEDQSPPTDTHIRVLSIYMLRAYDTEGLRLFPHYLVRQ